MYRVVILNIDEYTFTLQDEDNNIYKKVIEFMNTKYIPKVGDYLYLQEEILREQNIYAFGDIYDKNRDDIIKVETKNNVIYLQRYYG